MSRDMDKTNRNRIPFIRQLELWILIAAFFVVFLMFLLDAWNGKSEHQFFIFFHKGGNYMADLYNVLIYSMEKNPYGSGLQGIPERAYLPLSYLICFWIAKLAHIEHYYEGYDGTIQSMDSIPIAIGVYVVFVMLMLVMLQLYDMLQAGRGYKLAISMVMMLSGAMLFAYERGILVLLSVSGMILFLHTYDCENKKLREFGYFGLAFAAALKGYPALLGLLLIDRHEWKEMVRLILYGVILSFGPFLLLQGGLSNIPVWLNNVKANSETYLFLEQPKLGYLYFIAYAKDVTEDWQNAMYHMWKPIVTGVSVLGAVSSYFQSKKWLQIGTLVCIILMYPSNSGFYCLLYMLPVIILYLNEPEKTWTDLLYLPIFIVMLSPYQIVDNTGKNWTLHVINIALCILFAACILENIVCFIRWGKIKRKRMLKNAKE